MTTLFFVFLIFFVILNGGIQVHGQSQGAVCNYPNRDRLEVFYMASEPQSQNAIRIFATLPKDILNYYQVVFLPCFDSQTEPGGSLICKGGQYSCMPDMYEVCAFEIDPQNALMYAYATAIKYCDHISCLPKIFDPATQSAIKNCVNGPSGARQLCSYNSGIPRQRNPDGLLYYPIIELNEKWLTDGKNGGPIYDIVVCLLCQQLSNCGIQTPSCWAYQKMFPQFKCIQQS